MLRQHVSRIPWPRRAAASLTRPAIIPFQSQSQAPAIVPPCRIYSHRPLSTSTSTSPSPVTSPPSPPQETLLTLAIESSCDDTCVALLLKSPVGASLLYNRRITSDHRQYHGIVPTAAVEGHTSSLAPLVASALTHLPLHDPATHKKPPVIDINGIHRRRPDFVAVTRGPGMGASLAVGLNTAKGLAAAWGVPLVGVHHMQAHALTPRLVDALSKKNTTTTTTTTKVSPQFPFATLLISGGHTTLIHTTSLTSHRILAETDSIAIGDALDKMARHILPPSVLSSCPDTMYARALEEFAFPGSTTLSPVPLLPGARHADYAEYVPPKTREEEDRVVRHRMWDWYLSPPLAGTRRMQFNFSGLSGQVKKLVIERTAQLQAQAHAAADDDAPTTTDNTTMSTDERRALARCTMRVAFEHLASRVVMMLQERDPKSKFYFKAAMSMRGRARYEALSLSERRAIEASMLPLRTLVVSGGVASNRYLMHILRRYLAERGYSHVTIAAPPVEHCTDNAAMVAWAGMEMYEAGWVSEMGVLATTTWPMDAEVEGGGILEVGGWTRGVE